MNLATHGSEGSALALVLCVARLASPDARAMMAPAKVRTVRCQK